MAGKLVKNISALALSRQNLLNSLSCRRFANSVHVSQSLGPSEEDDKKKDGWLRRLIPIRRIDPGKESHSTLLSDKDTVYEIQMHSVKPEHMEQYLNEYHDFVKQVQNKETGAELAGSWTVEIGDQDEAIHLWKYPGGYPVLNRATEIYRTDKEFVDFRISRNKMLRSRKNQILLAFSFWGDIIPRTGKNIYELRSYVLKPGTMIEWGNNWAKGIKYRQGETEALAGFFSHIGDLYQVHHFWVDECRCDADEQLTNRARAMQYRQNKNEAVGGFFSQIGQIPSVHQFWAYSSLESRKEVREAAWRRPGWDECVAYTVPLIRHMTARILIPTPFSPCQ